MSIETYDTAKGGGDHQFVIDQENNPMNPSSSMVSFPNFNFPYTYQLLINPTVALFFHQHKRTNNELDNPATHNVTTTILQPQVNHHSINFSNPNFREMKNSIRSGQFIDSSPFHYTLYKVKELTEEECNHGNDYNCSLSLVSIDHSVYGYKKHIIDVYNSEEIQTILIPFFHTVCALNLLQYESLLKMDNILYNLSIVTKNKGLSGFFLGDDMDDENNTGDSVSDHYIKFFQENTKNNVQNHLDLLRSFQFHVLRLTKFRFGTLEGIHRLYCLNDLESMKYAIQMTHKNEECYNVTEKNCYVTGFRDIPIDSDVSLQIEKQLLEMRQFSKQTMISKSKNIKVSSLDVFESFCKDHYSGLPVKEWMFSLNDEDDKKKKVSSNIKHYFERYILQMTHLFVNTLKKDTQSGCQGENIIESDSDNETQHNLIANFTNPVVMIAYQDQIINADTIGKCKWTQFWEKFPSCNVHNWRLKSKGMTNLAFGSQTRNKDSSLFAKDFLLLFYPSQTLMFIDSRKEDKDCQHVVIYAMTSIIFAVNTNSGMRHLLMEKIQESRVMERMIEEDNSKQLGRNRLLIDCHFIGMFMFIFYKL